MGRSPITIYRNPKFRAVIIQALLVFLVAYAFYSLYQTTVYNLEERGIKTSTSFFDQVAPFKVGFSPFLNFELGETTYIKVFYIGVLNTLLVAVLGIVAATFLGFFIGIIRSSNNWLAQKFALTYVEIFRNMPLLLQIMFWNFAIFLAFLPPPKQSLEFGVFYLNGVESPSNFPLLKGVTYIFDQSNSTNSSYNSQAHPLMFSTGDDGDHNGNGHYLDGVTYKLDGAVVNMAGYVSGFAAATTRTAEFAVPSTAPSTLYYWCHSHTNQGDSIAVNSFSDGTTTGVNLTGGSGSSAQATVEVVGGIVTTITITDGGLGYSTTDTNLGLTGFTNLVLATGTLTNPTGMEFTVSSISLGSGLVLDATACLLYTSPSPRDKRQSRMPSSA